jgi:hypothetical protein
MIVGLRGPDMAMAFHLGRAKADVACQLVAKVFDMLAFAVPE